ncbi:hypothetical protein CGH34_14900, partial [Vibrio parahaemolyticus]
VSARQFVSQDSTDDSRLPIQKTNTLNLSLSYSRAHDKRSLNNMLKNLLKAISIELGCKQL